jgi:hypothetical protein
MSWPGAQNPGRPHSATDQADRDKGNSRPALTASARECAHGVGFGTAHPLYLRFA